MRASLFSQAASDRTRGYGLKLRHGRLRLDLRKNFFMEKAFWPLEGAAQGGLESSSLEVSKERLDMALSAVVWLT